MAELTVSFPYECVRKAYAMSIPLQRKSARKHFHVEDSSYLLQRQSLSGCFHPEFILSVDTQTIPPTYLSANVSGETSLQHARIL